MAPSYTLRVNHFYGEKNGMHEEMIQKVRGHSQRPGAETASRFLLPESPPAFERFLDDKLGSTFGKHSVCLLPLV